MPPGEEPRTPIAWQHRDLNYHQSGYQDKYGPGADGGGGSDRMSSRLERVWPPPSYSRRELAGLKEYPPRDYPSPSLPPRDYPDMSPPRGQGSGTATSTLSSSTCTEDESDPPPTHQVPPPSYHPSGYYPPMSPYHPQHSGSNLKSSKSIPSLLAPTVDGEPCPYHHQGIPPHFSPPPMPPPMVHPGYATMGPPRRAASIYDMRLMSPGPPPIPTIYGTLPHHPPAPQPPPSMVGSAIMTPPAPGAPVGIPPHLLPPMARPNRPLVLGEGGTPEVLPVRGGKEKAEAIAKSLKEDASEEKKRKICCRGGICVTWMILGVIVLGVMVALILTFVFHG